MRLVSWVFWGLVVPTAFAACGDPEESGAKGSGGSATGGSAGSTAGTNPTGGSSTQGGSAGTTSGGTAGTDDAGAGGSDGGTSGTGKGGTAGDDGGTGGDGGFGGGHDDPDAASFMSELWGAYCQQLMRCGIPNDDAIGQRLMMETEARCHDALQAILGDAPQTTDLLAKVEAGTLIFNTQHIEACLIETTDCMWQGFFSHGPACRQVFEGRVPNGGACRRWEDCAGNAYCDHTTGCPGVCTAQGEPGTACGSNDQCNPGEGYAFCNFSATEPVCARLPIGEPAGLGLSCTVRAAEVSELVMCQVGLWCDPGDGTMPTGTCAEPIPSGQPCDSADDVCADGSFCSEVSCDPVTIGHEAGAACDETKDTYCDVFAGLICEAGSCEPPGDGTEDATCRAEDILELVTCDSGLYCDQVGTTNEGTCQPLLDAAELCDSGTECMSGFCDTTCTENYCDG